MLDANTNTTGNYELVVRLKTQLNQKLLIPYHVDVIQYDTILKFCFNQSC